MEALTELCRDADLSLSEVVQFTEDEFRELSRTILQYDGLRHARVFRQWRQAHGDHGTTRRRRGEHIDADNNADDAKKKSKGEGEGEGSPLREVSVSGGESSGAASFISEDGGGQQQQQTSHSSSGSTRTLPATPVTPTLNVEVKAEDDAQEEEVQIVPKPDPEPPEAVVLPEDEESESSNDDDEDKEEESADDDSSSSSSDASSSLSSSSSRGSTDGGKDGGVGGGDGGGKGGSIRVVATRGATIRTHYGMDDTIINDPLGKLKIGDIRRYVEKRWLPPPPMPPPADEEEEQEGPNDDADCYVGVMRYKIPLSTINCCAPRQNNAHFVGDDHPCFGWVSDRARTLDQSHGGGDGTVCRILVEHEHSDAGGTATANRFAEGQLSPGDEGLRRTNLPPSAGTKCGNNSKRARRNSKRARRNSKRAPKKRVREGNYPNCVKKKFKPWFTDEIKKDIYVRHLDRCDRHKLKKAEEAAASRKKRASIGQSAAAAAAGDLSAEKAGFNGARADGPNRRREYARDSSRRLATRSDDRKKGWCPPGLLLAPPAGGRGRGGKGGGRGPFVSPPLHSTYAAGGSKRPPERSSGLGRGRNTTRPAWMTNGGRG